MMPRHVTRATGTLLFRVPFERPKLNEILWVKGQNFKTCLLQVSYLICLKKQFISYFLI